MIATVAVTRPMPQARATAQRLTAHGLVARSLPLLTLSRCGAVEAFSSPTALAFTSQTAPMLLRDRPDLHALPVFAVGERTAREAERAGFRTVASAGGDVTDLAAVILAAAPAHLVHICGRAQKGDLTGTLRNAGVRAEKRIIYDMLDTRTFSAVPTDAVLLYSPRTADAFAAGARGTPWRAVPCVALSPDVAAPLGPEQPVRIASAPNEDAMVRALLSLPTMVARRRV